MQNKLRFQGPISDSNSSNNSENDRMSMNSQNINDMIKNNINRETAYREEQPKTHYIKGQHSF